MSEKSSNFAAAFANREFARTIYYQFAGKRVVVLISLRSNDLLPVCGQTGSSSARLEYLLWEQGVVSSNLAYPTKSHLFRRWLLLFFLQQHGLALSRSLYTAEAYFVEVVTIYTLCLFFAVHELCHFVS